jgi:predicted CoA-binding protein
MKTVAVIGATNNRNKFGNKAVRAYRQQGYLVYPVSLSETEIEEEKAYRSILDVPVRPDRVTVYIPPQQLLKILPDIAVKGCDELWLNPGTESPEVVAEAKRLGLNAVEACSILDLGVSPHAM